MKKIKLLFLGLLTGLVLSVCARCGQTAGENALNADIAKADAAKAGSGTDAPGTNDPEPEDAVSWSDLAPIDALDLKYADQFSVTYYGEEKYALVTIGEDEKFLVVP